MNPKAAEYVKNRSDLQTIAKLVPFGARIMDLGCGEGLFLRYLMDTKQIKALGIDIVQEQIIRCIGNGVPVVHGDLNEKMYYAQENSFDFVILSCTLQEMVYPDQLLAEMLRIGKKAIVGVINFGYIKNRIQLLLSGRMPMSKSLPHQWYSTPNIHLGTLQDFRDLCKASKIRIVEQIPLSHDNRTPTLSQIWPNLWATNCVFVIEKE